MLYDVFISYSHKDKTYVHEFTDELRKAGYNVWIDKTGIHSTEDFKNRIVEAIDNSECFIFFSSKSANKSTYSIKEVGVAVELGKPILPIKLDKANYTNSILFDLVNIDYIDATTHDKSYVLKRAIDSVSIHCGKKSIKDLSKNGEKRKNNLQKQFLYFASCCFVIVLFLLVILFIDKKQSIPNVSHNDTSVIVKDTLITAIVPNNDSIKNEILNSIVVDSNEFILKQYINQENWQSVKTMADNGYTPAYIPLAKHYMKSSSTHYLADRYAQKAIKSGYQKEAIIIINQLKQYHYYD